MKIKFQEKYTYINASQEMEYIESTNNYVKVNLAGKQFYAKQSEILLIPYQQVEKETTILSIIRVNWFIIFIIRLTKVLLSM